MHILVTGAAGLVGRHLTHALKERGDTVRVLDTKLGDHYTNDAMWYFQTQESLRFDVVYHCAAFINGRSGIDGSPAYLHTYNTMLDAAMFTWALKSRPGRVVYFSSSAAYPVIAQTAARGNPLKEKDILVHNPLRPETTYGLSKLHGEQMAMDAREAGVPVTVLRPFSGFSADQDEFYPFRAFLERAKARQDPFEVWGDGFQQRDWIHVTDLVGAAIAAVDNHVDGPVNVCTGRGTTFIELAGLFMEAAGYNGTIRMLGDKPGGVDYRVGDPTKLNEFFQHGVSIEQGVRDALAA